MKKILISTISCLAITIVSLGFILDGQAAPPPPKKTPSDGTLFGITPHAPTIYTDGLTRLQVPDTKAPARGAFALIEAMQQLGESYIQLAGCTSAVKGTADIFTDANGIGDSTLVTPGSTFKASVKRAKTDAFRGDVFTVTSASGVINNKTFSKLLGNYKFNRNGSIMDGSAYLETLNNGTVDKFTSAVIKDFFLYTQSYLGQPRVFTLDWGLQSLDKLDYPVAKFFQRSYSLEDDGLEGITVFKKVRIAGGTPCAIEVNLKGFNNSEEFNEQGKFSIKPVKLTHDEL